MDHSAQGGSSPDWSLVGCDIISNGEALSVHFLSASFTFHAQWLDDARCDHGPSRTALSAFCQKPAVARILKTHTNREGAGVTIDVNWLDGSVSSFPAIWLRIMGPLVGEPGKASPPLPTWQSRGWLTDSLKIPSFDYKAIFTGTAQTCEATAVSIMDEILMAPNTGIVKITGLPAPNIESEREKTNTLVTQVLKQIFGAVFQHPRRSGEKTFNVASHHEEDSKRAAGLPNYDTSQILLPHVDHAHYQHPIQVQGWYGLEGESENTFVSGLQALNTLLEEAPEMFEPLITAPMSVGRVVHYYDPPLYQGTVDTAVTMYPGTAQVKRIRWHPHLTGSIVAPFDEFRKARAAHHRLQEIIRRDTHQLKVILQPGDLYLWNNFTILHGRERVLQVPRTGVGQTVPEQVVADRYRALKIGQLRGYLEEKWLVHMPAAQLFHLGELLHCRSL
ncbi:MAG: hypothetical protein HETSPECPRED_010310 [Heterodermia speciosa]|uniref:TauD/TfdA-like domain-containing protein n=1 Tax=Heterodermia speciosa TaxID=116794 RepID=A0A8H3G1N4_9LECA|nr:MAG: hypothetical protein HETSPECPRED_010310 [Heterodermia speciosa]